MLLSNNDTEVYVIISEEDIEEDSDKRGAPTFLGSPLTDGTIEEDFQAALSRDMAKDSAGSSGLAADGRPKGGVFYDDDESEEENFSDIASRGIIEVVGDDKAGNKVIVISACRFPCNQVGSSF